jgi:hypothetical protein
VTVDPAVTALIMGWADIAVLVALAVGCGLEISLAIASQPAVP